jgi:RES domain-containing protein
MTPVSAVDQLKTRLTYITTSRFTATVYRSSTPKYATETDLLTGEGSKRFGGRWNPVGVAVVYASLTPETAMAETLAHHRYYGLPIEDAMPRTFVAIKAQLMKIVDFRLGVNRQRLKLSLDRMHSIDWRKEIHAGREPVTQQMGRAAFEFGLEGIIVPSAADLAGHNLLVFPGNLSSESTVQVLHSGGLMR